jgi:hypothetical protein
MIAADLRRRHTGDPGLGESLLACDDAFADHMAAAHRRFGSAALGVIDLPPLGTGSVIAAQVRIAAALYLLRELETAGIVPMVESLAEALSLGTLMLPVGGAVHRLARVARNRDERLTAGERQRIFEQVFGGALGASADKTFGALALELSQLGRDELGRSGSQYRARIGVLARDLGGLLSDRAVGMAAFAAREMADQVREGMALLADADLATSLGGGDLWTLLSRNGRRFLGRDLAPRQNIARGRAGMAIIEWVAAAAANPEAAAGALSRHHAIVHAAEAWLAEGGQP